MLASSKAHLQVEDALEVVNRFTHGDQVIRRDLSARDGTEVLCIPPDVFHHFCRLLCVLVVLGYDIVPWELAKTAQSEPSTKQREPVERFSLLLKGRHEVVHHIKKDQPCLVVLRTLESQPVTALLCK